MMGDTINVIHRLENHRNAIIVHTRDNCIRVLNYEKNKVFVSHPGQLEVLRRQFLEV